MPMQLLPKISSLQDSKLKKCLRIDDHVTTVSLTPWQQMWCRRKQTESLPSNKKLRCKNFRLNFKNTWTASSRRHWWSDGHTWQLPVIWGDLRENYKSCIRYRHTEGKKTKISIFSYIVIYICVPKTVGGVKMVCLLNINYKLFKHDSLWHRL